MIEPKAFKFLTSTAVTYITLNNVTDTAAADFIIDLDKTTLMGPDFSVINLSPALISFLLGSRRITPETLPMEVSSQQGK